MRLQISLLIITLSLGVFSCTEPQAYKIPTDSEQWQKDEGFQKAIEKLPEDEKKLLLGYMTRTIVADHFGVVPSERTIGEALQNQRDFVTAQVAQEAADAEEQAKQEALAKKVEEDRQQKITEARKALTVAVTRLEFVPSNMHVGRFQDGFLLSVALQNNTAKDMTGIKGTVVFADMFGDDLKRVTFSIDAGIPAGESIRWDGELDYNPYIDEDVNFRQAEFTKMKITWEPEIYLFTDGSTMQIEG